MLPHVYLSMYHETHAPGSWLHSERSQDPDTELNSRNLLGGVCMSSWSGQ